MSRKLRLLKFDSVHPFDVLVQKQDGQREHLSGLGYEDYYRWLMGQRLGFSDFLTHHMNEAGWGAREVIAADRMLLQKLPGVGRPSLASEAKASLRRLASSSLKDVVTLGAFKEDSIARGRRVVERYINAYKPDVLFIREPSHVKGRLWDRFRDRCLIVGFIGGVTTDAWHWNTHRHDVIFTLTDEYNNFFKAEGVESHLFSYGVDERVAAEVAGSAKKHDCTFVGYLGIPDQRIKTRLLEFIAQNVDFKWWGVRGPEIREGSALHRSWQGAAAGIEMFQIYRDSKIVLNEYPEIAMGKNVNIRTMEVLNVGTFLLTRAATNITWLEQAGALVTFNSPEDCLAKVQRFLGDDTPREKIAAEGQRMALKHFNYRDITRDLMDVIGRAWENKRGRLKPWPAR
jgi:hypothetical protein